MEADSKILVTGGLGYIGSHTVIRLVEEGFRVVICDNLSNSEVGQLERLKKITGKDIEFVQADVCNRTALEKIFQSNKISAVIHFAACKSVPESLLNPMKYYENNFWGTSVLVGVMQSFNVTKLIFSSSASVYGNSETKNGIKENEKLAPINPYGNSKFFAEKFLEDFVQAHHDWQIISLRYFNPVGAHESGDIGENLEDYGSNLVPQLIKNFANEDSTFTIFGSDYPTRDGTAVRDYVHVMDLAQGHVSAMMFFQTLPRYAVINLGTGNGFTVREVIAQFNKILPRPIAYVVGPRRNGDGAISFANTDLAKDLLGWSAEKSLENMCEDTFNWYKNFKKDQVGK